MIVNKQNGNDNRTTHLFRLDKEIYSIDEDSIRNNSDQFSNKDDMKKYFIIFVDLIKSDMTPIQKKTHMSDLMDKLIDWKKLINRLKSDVVDILKIDDNIMKNRNVIFH